MLNVNSAIYKAQGVDINSVNATANQILSKPTETQPTVQAIDYSKFNRPTLGIDLYSSRTNVDLQKQIALTQAGLYSQSINVAQLNSAAAASLYSASTVQKNVELTQSTQAYELFAPQKLTEETSKIQLFNIADKNSRSSNGFNPFNETEESLAEEKTEKEIKLFV